MPLFSSVSHLADEVRTAPHCAVEPLSTDSFIARSAFQKAIRRGDQRTALRAAATLMELDPDVLWKRLLVTSLEDIGVGEFDLLAKIVIAQGKRTRRSLGPDWTIATTLIRQACEASKCQAANDLHNIAANHPELEPFRTKIAGASRSALLPTIGGSSVDPARRYVAVLRFLDSSGLSSNDVDALFAAVGSSNADAAWFYRQAFTKSRLGLAAASLILLTSAEAGTGSLAMKDDDLPDTDWIAGVPAYALDQYTRSGRRALQRFVIENGSWRSFARSYQLGEAAQLKAAGELLFRAEGALLKRRRHWDVGRDLYLRSATVGCFMPPCAVPSGLALIREQLPDLNRFRRGVLGYGS